MCNFPGFLLLVWCLFVCCHGFDVVHDLGFGPGLRVLGCVEPGFGLGLDLDVGLDLFSGYVIACIPTFLDSQDEMHQHCMPELMAMRNRMQGF